MWTISWGVILIGIGALFLTGVGAVVFFRGKYRRVGTTPRCPRCEYNLTGNDSGVCPECGAAFTAKMLVHGERPRRAGPAIIGVVLMLIGLTFGGLLGSGMVSQVEWYHYRPLRWVMRDLDSTFPGADAKAWAELERRDAQKSLSPSQRIEWLDRAIKDLDSTNGFIVARVWPDVESALNSKQLSEAQIDALVERGLRGQLAASSTSSEDRLLELIGDRFVAGKLSSSQTDRLFAGCTSLVLKTRPQVGPKDDIPYLIEESGQGPHGWWRSIEMMGVWVDERKIRDGGGSTSGEMSRGAFGSEISHQPVGRHLLKVEIEVAISSGSGGILQAAKHPALYKQARTLTTPFEVLFEGIPIRFISAPESATVSRSVSADTFQFSDHELSGTIDLRMPPVNVAFDAFALIDGKEYPMGHLAGAKGYECGFGVFCEHPPAKPFEKFDIVLRSSANAAKSTLDLTEIWQGEVVIKDVGVRTRGPR